MLPSGWTYFLADDGDDKNVEGGEEDSEWKSCEEMEDVEFDPDQAAIDKEISEEEEGGGGEWQTAFSFVILTRDAQGRPILSMPSPLNSNYGSCDVKGSDSVTPSTALFSGVIRQYLTYSRPPLPLGPTEFVYYLVHDLETRHAPDDSHPIHSRLYSDELCKRTKEVYRGKTDRETYMAKEKQHVFFAVVLHRLETFHPKDLVFPIVRVDDWTLKEVTLKTTLLDFHALEKDPDRKDKSGVRFLWDDWLGKIDLPLLFLGWSYCDGEKKEGAVTVELRLF